MALTRTELRQQFRAMRNHISDEQQGIASQQLVTCALSYNLFKGVEVVAAYIANDGELSPSALINYLWERNITVCLPVLHPFTKNTLLFMKYERTTLMRKNKFNIDEPYLNVTKVIPILNIDIILTPLVVFDEFGNRLGMGGGFYDRSLAAFRLGESKNPRLIGLAHDQQKVQQLPIESWDVPLQQILTPSQLYTFV